VSTTGTGSLTGWQKAIDISLALVLAVGSLAAAAVSRQPGVCVPLVVMATISLVWRRRWPVAVWAVSGACTLAAVGVSESATVVVLSPLVALYTVALTSPRAVSRRTAVVTTSASLVAVYLAHPAGSLWPTYVAAVVVTLAFWLVGDNLRVRRAYVAELEAKAARAEADRAAELAQAAAQERERIARELHDVVAHHVSVIAVQAGAARLLAEGGAGATTSRDDWAAIEDTARQALTELRQLLGVLRHGGEAPSLAPQPGLGQLERLLDEVRSAGLPVRSELEGTPVALPSALDLSAYRIVQEALTNVMKHEGRVPTLVVVRYGPAEVEVTVENDGGGPRPVAAVSGAGHGLVGMRERVGVLGGELDAGPRTDGGFAVRARLPLDHAL
jgi:signal transduction histidine kinase